jgi:cytochrome c-type biogenesis protein CcmH
MGLAAAQAGEFQQAVDIWISMLQGAPVGAAWTEVIHRRLSQVAEAEGIDIAGRLDALPAARPAPMPTREMMEAAAEMTFEERRDMILGMVAGLSARLEDTPGDIAGWQRLIRSYAVLEMRDEAKAALARALAANAGDTAAETQLTSTARTLGIE